jgi:hypothetical protein
MPHYGQLPSTRQPRPVLRPLAWAVPLGATAVLVAAAVNARADARTVASDPQQPPAAPLASEAHRFSLMDVAGFELATSRV